MSAARDPQPIGPRLNDQGWRQGAIADESAEIVVAAALRRQARDDLATQLDQHQACAVAVSQTCDIVCLSDLAEPYVEFAIASIVSGDPDPQDTHLKSFRRFATPLSEGKQHLVFRPWDRCLVERGALIDAPPSTALAIDRRGRQDLVDWLTMRYKRAALPDAFNERLRAAGAETTLRKALAGVPAVTEVFLLLNPRGQELAEATVPYQCDIVLLCRREVYLDSRAREAIEPAVLEVENILASVPGIEVESVHLRGEHAFSRHEMREYDRWQLDDISYAADARLAKRPGAGKVQHDYSAESSRDRDPPEKT